MLDVFVWIVHSEVEIFTSNSFFTITVVTTASGLRWQLPPVDFFGQGQATKRCTPVKARQFRTAVSYKFWEDVFYSEQRRKPLERRLRFPLMVVFFKLQGAKSSQNFCAQFQVWQLWMSWGALWIGTLPLSCWSTSTNRNGVPSLQKYIRTWMKMPPTLQMFVPKWKQMGAILNWISTGSVFSSDVIESYTKLFGEAGTIYLHPVGQKAAGKRKQSSFEPLLSKCFF